VLSTPGAAVVDRTVVFSLMLVLDRHDRGGRGMRNDYADVIGEMRSMQDRIRAIRERYCDPKGNQNPRYLALSNAVAGLNRAVADMQAESDPTP
jgi:hypothetical protein